MSYSWGQSQTKSFVWTNLKHQHSIEANPRLEHGNKITLFKEQSSQEMSPCVPKKRGKMEQLRELREKLKQLKN